MDCERCKLLTKISECQFILVELNLYLDTHPDDDNARADYCAYAKVLKELMHEYECKYDPLMNFGHSACAAGSYVCSKWPWEL
ncbi:MAG: spore coat protein CotJB [Clostridia bacterium]|nr:spore coat protein CotJB [Clostridia bacterium]